MRFDFSHNNIHFDWVSIFFHTKAINTSDRGGQIQSDYECKPNHENVLDC